MVDGGQTSIEPCGNMRNVKFIINSSKITDPSKMLMHVGVNDIDNQHPEEIAKNFVTISKKIRKKFECNVHLSDITLRNEYFQGHVEAVHQALVYKMSKSLVISSCQQIIFVMINAVAPWYCGLMVVTTAQLDSTKPEPRFCTGSNLIATCWGLTMMRISGNGLGWK